MKRTLSAILILIMLVSALSVLPTYATADVHAGYTAVSSLADFKAMTSGGKYYLTTNLTIDATSGMQNGTFDGCGYTITLGTGVNSVFGWFGNGTMNVSNLTIEGSVSWDNSQATFPEHIGPLVMHGGNRWNVDNVVSKVDITIHFGADYVGNNDHHFGGIISKAEGNCSITNSTYEGTVTITGDKMRNSFGGIVGVLKAVEGRDGNTVSGCKNKGSINASADGYAENDNVKEKLGIGGIVGKVNSTDKAMSITNCVNDGVISSTAPLTNVGGILGIVQEAPLTVSGCSNLKAISGVSASVSNMGVGGIIGASNYANALSRKLTVSDCSNSGALSVVKSDGATYVGGIIGRAFRTGLIDILDCVNTGVIAPSEQVNNDFSGTGGIVGGFTTLQSFDGIWNIKNCSNSAEVTGVSATGAMVGVALQIDANISLTVASCVNSGAITSSQRYAGGMIGAFGVVSYGSNKFGSAIFRNCYNSGSVTGKLEGAGIISNMNSPNGDILIEGCANSGNLTCNDTDAPAGIMSKWQNSATVKSCVNTGALGTSGVPIAPTPAQTSSASITATDNTYSNSGSFNYGTYVSAATANASASTISTTASKPDMTELKAAIALTDSMEESDYTPATWANMTAALTAARQAESSATTQVAVNTATENLKTAITGLRRADINYSALEEKITEAEALDLNKYSVVSRIELKAAIDGAKKALDASTQAEVNNARVALMLVMSSLRKGPQSAVDYCELKYWIADAESLEEKDYTADSWSAMLDKLSAARAALTETNQIEVNGVSDALKTAIKALEKAPATDSATDTAEDSGCGSSIGAASVSVFTMLVFGMGTVIRKKRD